MVVAGLAAVVQLFLRGGSSAATLVLGVIVLVALMVLFLVFSLLVELVRKGTSGSTYAAQTLLWTSLVLVMLTAVATFTSTFANTPLPLYDWVVYRLRLPTKETPLERFEASYAGSVVSNLRGRIIRTQVVSRQVVEIR